MHITGIRRCFISVQGTTNFKPHSQKILHLQRPNPSSSHSFLTFIEMLTKVKKFESMVQAFTSLKI